MHQQADTFGNINPVSSNANRPPMHSDSVITACYISQSLELKSQSAHMLSDGRRSERRWGARKQRDRDEQRHMHAWPACQVAIFVPTLFYFLLKPQTHTPTHVYSYTHVQHTLFCDYAHSLHIHAYTSLQQHRHTWSSPASYGNTNTNTHTFCQALTSYGKEAEDKLTQATTHIKKTHTHTLLYFSHSIIIYAAVPASHSHGSATETSQLSMQRRG